MGEKRLFGFGQSLLHKGVLELQHKDTGTVVAAYLWLFSDALIVALVDIDNKNKLYEVLALEACHVQIGGDPNVFVVEEDYNEPNRNDEALQLVFLTPTPAECDSWTSKINHQIEQSSYDNISLADRERLRCSSFGRIYPSV